MKHASAIVLIFLLLVVVVPSTCVRITVARSGILIRRDGSITPKSAPISTSDNVTYSLTDDIDPIDYDGIQIDRSDIILDGAGHSVRGAEYGMGESGDNNVTIENINVRDCGTGINAFMATGFRILSSNITNNSCGIQLVYYSSDSIIAWNNITGNSCGIRFMHFCSRNGIFENTLVNNGIGMDIEGSSDNCLTRNTITNNGEGIFLSESSNSTLSGNIFSGNDYSFSVDGGYLQSFENSIDTSNLINGKPIYYLVNQKDLIINPETCPEIGYLGLADCVNVTVEMLELTNNGEGILLAYTNNSRIAANNVTNNKTGIHLVESSENDLSENNIANNENGIALFIFSNNNTLVENNITANSLDGVVLNYRCDSNMIRRNCVTENNAMGIRLSYSKHNNIIENSIAANEENGISVYEGSNSSIVEGNNITENHQHGILIVNSACNVFAKNIVKANEAFGIAFDNSNYNEIYENTLTYCFEGVDLLNSSNNALLQNDISDNIVGVSLGYSNLNILTENSITECTQIAFYIVLSSNNYIYHNNFWNNIRQVISGKDLSNIWDIGYPYGGNYWSNYNGDDFLSGQHQNETYSDGIGDTPHDVDPYDIDNYPLMNPWKTGEVFTAVHSNQNYEVEITSNATAQNFSFNDANREIVFNLTSDINTIGYCHVVFDKELISYPLVSVSDSMVPCATVDNTTHWFIYFTLQLDSTSIVIYQRNPADVNRDGKIDVKDVFAAAKTFGSDSSCPNWNSNCDLNQDLKIDLKDLYIICSNYGKVHS